MPTKAGIQQQERHRGFFVDGIEMLAESHFPSFQIHPLKDELLPMFLGVDSWQLALIAYPY